MQAEIDDLIRRAAADPGVIGLAGGLPSPVQFPRKALSKAFLDVIGDRSTPALQYGWPEGSLTLRQRVSERLARRGVEVGPDEIVVTSGAQQALSIVADVLCDPGDAVLVDPESYPAALDLFRTRGLRLVTSGEARFRYAMPAVGNPSGRAMGDAEREALLASGLHVVEDDAYAELRFDAAPKPPLLGRARDRVFHVGTFSKVLAPGLRIGWLVPPPEHKEAVLARKAADDLHANSLSQAIVERVVAKERFDRHLARLRRFYARRARALATALSGHLPRWRFTFPEGGFALWVTPEPPLDELDLLRAALDEGVSFDPGRLFRVAPGPPAMRLCYSWAPAAQLEEGVRRLACAAAKLA